MEEAFAQPPDPGAITPRVRGQTGYGSGLDRPGPAVGPDLTSPPSSPSAGPCVTCGQPIQGTAAPTWATPPQGSFVKGYRLARAAVPSTDVENEFAQLSAQLDNPEASEHLRLKAVLERDDNLYLAHHICWVLTTEGFDSFAVVPQDNDGARELVAAFAPASDEGVLNVVVGGPAGIRPVGTGPQQASAGGRPAAQLTLDEFLDGLSAEDDGGAKKSGTDPKAVRRELFRRLTQNTDNHGIADVHRARNYIVVRYPWSTGPPNGRCSTTRTSWVSRSGPPLRATGGWLRSGWSSGTATPRSLSVTAAPST